MSSAPDSRELRFAFSIAGVQKSGTTTLAATLDTHPQIAKAPRKEMTFFIREDIDWSQPSYDDYRVFAKRDRHRIAGDSTPAYLFWPHALERMRDYNPDMRLIVLFRDPIERAFSHWSMERRRQPASSLDWPEALEQALAMPLPEEVPAEPSKVRFRREGSMVARGFYSAQVERGLRVFPAEQWHYIEFRQLLSEFHPTLDAVTDFLGVSRFRRARELPHKMAGADSVVGTPPTAEDVAALVRAYETDVLRLADLTGVSTDHWPTVRIIRGEMDPGELAAKLGKKVTSTPAED